jgi:flagellar export protein FliJ
MARGFSLQIVYDLARKRVEVAERTVKQTHGVWLRARAQLVRLEAERSHYVQLLAQQRNTGEAGFYAAATEGWKALNLRMKQGREDVDASHASWLQAIEAWQLLDKRMRALTVLLQRYRDEQIRREAVRERKVHDEISARNFIAARQESLSGYAWEEHLS